MAAVFAYPFARITMSNYRYIIQAAEKQLLINIDRQVARQLGHVGYLHVPRWGCSTLHRARIFQGRGLKTKISIFHVAAEDGYPLRWLPIPAHRLIKLYPQGAHLEFENR